MLIKLVVIMNNTVFLSQILLFTVHFRKRRSTHGILKNPSSSANTFWQIEKHSDSRSGKLKHVDCVLTYD